MFSSILKKKLTADQVATIFVNGICDVINRGFEPVVDCINDDPSFVKCPEIAKNNIDEFALIVITANLIEMERLTDATTGVHTLNLAIEKLAEIYGIEAMDMRQIVQDYRQFMKRVNLPSKTTLYAMSKAIFHKYELNDFQDEYFKRMNAPNPVFLKRLDEMLVNFQWNWDSFYRKYRF